MGGLWNLFCGEFISSNTRKKASGFSFMSFRQPNSCTNQASIIGIDILLLVLLLFCVTQKPSSRTVTNLSKSRVFSKLPILSAVFNGCLGMVYFGWGIWNLEENLRKTHTALPLRKWLPLTLQGCTWLLVSWIVSLQGNRLARMPLRLLAILAFFLAGIMNAFTISAAVILQGVSTKIVLDALTFPGAILLLLCTYKAYQREEIQNCSNASLVTDSDEVPDKPEPAEVTSFAQAGLIHKMSFWWLNPLMKKGRWKTLQDQDIPSLGPAERAESCYLQFLEQMNKQKQAESSAQPSILWAIILCHWKEILISGFFAFLKTTTLSAGPLILNAFVLAAEGKSGFKDEGYILAISLFFSKGLESIAQRQWYFRSRLIGLKVRSTLSATIYKKQLRLSNAGRSMYSSGQIMNHITVDAYRIGEFPYWIHQTWTTCLQLCLSLFILFHAVRLATLAALAVILITVFLNIPLANSQHKSQTGLMAGQDERLKASTEALVNMKVLKLYAWETHFRNVIEKLRKMEYKWLSAVQSRKACNNFLFWSSPFYVSAATFAACYFLKVPLRANNVFTFVATLRIVQDPIRLMPNVIEAVIQAKVAFTRIAKFLEAPELQSSSIRQKQNQGSISPAILIKSANFSWDEKSENPTLRNVNLESRCGQKLAVCGEVGTGKSTLLAAILGEVPNTQGTVQVSGKIAYVSQTAWIQNGSIQDNILFGAPMDKQRYQDTLQRCSLLKDLELLPHGDMTEIGERGINLSGGQKQRVQLARALYQDADIYLLDDPFSAVDAETATTLFNEYVMGALSRKAVLLVTHQVDFLPAFDFVLLMSDGEILRQAPYHELLASSQEFQELVNAHKETAGSDRQTDVAAPQGRSCTGEIKKSFLEKQPEGSKGDQLIKKEEREVGDTGFKTYIQYLSQNKGYLYFSLGVLAHLTFVLGQISQNSWMATNVDNPHVSKLRLILVYLMIGFASTMVLVFRSVFAVILGLQAAKSMFSELLHSLFRAPMTFYDSTPLGRILSRVSSDLSIVDLDVPMSMIYTAGATLNTYVNLGVLTVVAWQVLFVSIFMVYLAIHLQRYYYASAKELMRINGTTKSLVASHLAESVAGSMTIRAFEEEERFFRKCLELIDTNASPSFHNFAAREWLVQRLEMISAAVLASAALCMALLPHGTFSPGFIGMALSYGLSMNVSLVLAIQNQCSLENYVVSVERLNQYMHIPSEAPEVIEGNHPPPSWPAVGKVDICDLQVKYRPDTPLVLRGVTCTIEGGDKVGIVGRTGSGKTTFISALFRLVEPAAGKIVVDDIDISEIGLHDLRSRLGIIPQDPTLFKGTVRYNLDPLSQHTDEEIWEVLRKCQLRETAQEKEKGLDSLVMEDGSNWSMGQRQLFCLGRALLRKSRILVLDEATASIDNATDLILQKTIRTEFADCTVITVAHRIPTVMDCTKVLAMRDGLVVEYDEPTKLMRKEGSLFGQLVREYWSHFQSAQSH
ncbi:hypothetical protein K2173_028359 [Erythroxylum novogranatense]|uniref:ABC-type xenobiotic transporter n=1 Tax=Erythroxylum novogranatense TaxID=1862640 RepID=A0AAV8U1K0_9ROSI|nr:hypothetical protein K2173_028359 [Erythroxylum novogranatense]